MAGFQQVDISRHLRIGPNAVIEPEPKAAYQSVYYGSATQNYEIGDVRLLRNGRKFRYLQNDNSGNTLVPGRMVQQNWENGQMTGLVPSAGTAGDATITVTIGGGAIVANQFKGGWIFVEGPAAGSAEKGFMYEIASHPAAAGAATCAFTIDTPLLYAISTTSRVSVYPNPMGNNKSTSHGVKVVPANGQTYMALGVPLCRVTQAQYFWAQYKGICVLETDGSVVMVKGQRVERGEASDGCGQVAGDDIAQIYGTCVHAGGFSRMSLVALNLPEIGLSVQ